MTDQMLIIRLITIKVQLFILFYTQHYEATVSELNSKIAPTPKQQNDQYYASCSVTFNIFSFFNEWTVTTLELLHIYKLHFICANSCSLASMLINPKQGNIFHNIK